METRGRVRGKGTGYRRWRWLHWVLALLALVPLLVQGVTGALLSYERELRNGLGDGPMAGARMGTGNLLSELATDLEGAPRWLIWFAAETEPVWVRWAERDGTERSYLVDPASGAILAASTAWHRRFEVVLNIHRRLGLGRGGQIVMGTSALLLAGLLVSGLVLQIKRSRTIWHVLGRRRNGKRFWLWLHGSLGTWMTPVLLILALTGPVWSFAGYRALISWVTQSEATTYAPPEFELEEKAALNLQAVLKGAEELDPGSGAKRLILPEAVGTARFEWAPAGVPWENFRSRAWLHPQTGEVLRLDPVESYTAADKAIRWAYPLHIGKWGGSPTRFLHFLAALSLPFFAATGCWLYWKRKIT